MMKSRYSVTKYHGVNVIHDTMTKSNWPFGPDCEPIVMREKHKHRCQYSVLDAKAIVDWLNDRETFYNT